MREPELVRDCLIAMREAVSVPVTVKHRLGRG
jgi:tRNA-dihydrouridine synthase A